MVLLNKLNFGKQFMLSQQQRTILQMVSTQLEKKDFIIFGNLDLKFCLLTSKSIYLVEYEHFFMPRIITRGRDHHVGTPSIVFLVLYGFLTFITALEILLINKNISEHHDLLKIVLTSKLASNLVNHKPKFFHCILSIKSHILNKVY